MTTRISILVAALLAVLAPRDARAQFSDPVTASAQANKIQVRPGDQLVVAAVLTFEPGYHSWPAEVQADQVEQVWQDFVAEYDTWTAVRIDAPAGFTVGPVQWPELHAAKAPHPVTFEPADTLALSGRAVAYVPIYIDEEATLGETTLTVTIGYQACNDNSCLMPEDKRFELTVEVIARDATPAEGAAGDLFAGFDPTVFARMQAGELPAGNGASAEGRSFFGITMPSGDGLVGVVLIALLAALGGFVLNLTPCVLPIIPIKIMTISQHAGSPGKSLMLGLWMFLGVVAFWFAIGVPVAFLTSVTDPSRLFGIWWFTLAIGLIIAVMGVGIMGLFTIQLPQKAYMINSKADTAWGSFLFGVMTAVLGLPCFGFVAGALLAGAATMPPALILTIFAALGIGMGAPYLVLAAKPGWVDKIPRTGPASELVKQIMGLLLLAAAAFFVGAGILAYIGGKPAMAASLPWWGKVAHWWVIAFFVAASGVWMTLRTFQISKRTLNRAVFTLLSLLLIGASAGVGVSMTDKARKDFWILYTHEGWQASVDSGNVVVVKFTADWCLTCKAIEYVLSADPAVSLLQSADVVPIKGDLTSDAAPGWEKMAEHGQTGIPLLMIWGPGLDEPWTANAYTSEMVAEAIERARGTENAGG